MCPMRNTESKSHFTLRCPYFSAERNNYNHCINSYFPHFSLDHKSRKLIHTHTYIYIYMYMYNGFGWMTQVWYIYIYIYMCVCVCMYVLYIYIHISDLRYPSESIRYCYKYIGRTNIRRERFVLWYNIMWMYLYIHMHTCTYMYKHVQVL